MSVLHCVLIVAALMIMDECSGIILILIQIGSTCNKKYVLQVNIIGKQNNPSIRLYKGLLTITTLSPSTQTPIPLTDKSLQSVRKTIAKLILIGY